MSSAAFFSLSNFSFNAFSLAAAISSFVKGLGFGLTPDPFGLVALVAVVALVTLVVFVALVTLVVFVALVAFVALVTFVVFFAIIGTTGFCGGGFGASLGGGGLLIISPSKLFPTDLFDAFLS